MSPQGTVRRLVEAPLTPSSWPAGRRRSGAPGRDRQPAGRNHRNQSLLETYSSVADIEPAVTGRSRRWRSELKQAEPAGPDAQEARRPQPRGRVYQKREMPRRWRPPPRVRTANLNAQSLLVESKRRDIEAIRTATRRIVRPLSCSPRPIPAPARSADSPSVPVVRTPGPVAAVPPPRLFFPVSPWRLIHARFSREASGGARMLKLQFIQLKEVTLVFLAGDRPLTPCGPWFSKAASFAI